MELPDALAFARDHQQAVLVTLKASGRPQLSNIMYAVGDDGLIRISVTADRAKTVNAGRDTQVRGLCPNRERIVRRVRSFLDANPESALSITDICDEVGVTRRTLQNAIQEVFGISPQHYLKAIRLNGFRRALKACNPGLESIGDVAARWGFWHLSQLAQDYRRLFGELPSQTRVRCLNA